MSTYLVGVVIASILNLIWFVVQLEDDGFSCEANPEYANNQEKYFVKHTLYAIFWPIHIAYWVFRGLHALGKIYKKGIQELIKDCLNDE